MAKNWIPTGASQADPFEVADTAIENYNEDGSINASVDLRVPWADRHSIASLILNTPMKWPYTGDSLYASSMGIRAFGGKISAVTGTLISSEYAKLSIVYKTLSVSAGGVIYSESIEPSAEFLTVPHKRFAWSASQLPTIYDASTPSDDALQPEEAPGRLEIGLDYVVTFFNLSSVPSWVTTLIGKVNSANVFAPSLNLTFGVQTLLFNPPSISRNVAIGTGNKYTVTVRYTFKAQGWNKFWRAKTGAYASLYPLGGASPYLNFPTASFAGAVP